MSKTSNKIQYSEQSRLHLNHISFKTGIRFFGQLSFSLATPTVQLCLGFGAQL